MNCAFRLNGAVYLSPSKKEANAFLIFWHAPFIELTKYKVGWNIQHIERAPGWFMEHVEYLKP